MQVEDEDGSWYDELIVADARDEVMQHVGFLLKEARELRARAMDREASFHEIGVWHQRAKENEIVVGRLLRSVGMCVPRRRESQGPFR